MRVRDVVKVTGRLSDVRSRDHSALGSQELAYSQRARAFRTCVRCRLAAGGKCKGRRTCVERWGGAVGQKSIESIAEVLTLGWKHALSMAIILRIDCSSKY